MPPTRPTRRTLLTGLGGALLGVYGCTAADPRITAGRSLGPARSGTGPPSAGAPASPDPTPGLSGADAAARLEQRAATQAAALAAAGGGLSRSRRVLAEGLRSAHLAHVAALLSPEQGGSPSGSPSPSPPPPAGATLSALRRSEEQLAQRHLRSASVSRGTDALLWASLGVAARSYARALADPSPLAVRPSPRGEVPSGISDVAAQQDVVAQAHALIYGYQVALGRLPLGEESRTRAADALVARRVLRDRLTTRLIELRAEVPVASAAYALPVAVDDEESAGRLIRRMESAFLPHVGQWVAAAARARDGRLAVNTLVAVSDEAGRWGAAPQVWPGWP